MFPGCNAVTTEPTDAEFDAYWEEEARNPHRNRIRIGRQYQATIPPRLKSGNMTDTILRFMPLFAPLPIDPNY